MKLWGGNYEASPDAAFWEFNRSFPFDRRLIAEEVAASRAWVKALGRCAAIRPDEAEALDHGLEQVLSRAQEDARYLELDVEDVHSFVEERLGEIVGEIAGQAHLGRSRNEQTVTALRLFVRGTIDALHEATAGLVAALVEQGRAAKDAVMPGYTHTRAAEPITFGHWAAAHAWALVRDDERLRDARRRVDVLPLGSGALAGSALPLDREAMARDLGFAAVSPAALDAVMDRDFAIEFVSCCAQLQTHLARLAEDLIHFAGPEYGFVTLPEAFTTGSSLMPQKKNPDALELVRGKSARVDGDLMRLLALLKGLPAGYQKDLQEDKEAVFDAADTALGSVTIMAGVVAGLVPQREAMRAAAGQEEMIAANLAVALAREGLPFRKAHHVVGSLVGEAQKTGRTLKQTAAERLPSISPRVAARLDSLFDPLEAVKTKALTGGTAPDAVQTALETALARVGADRQRDAPTADAGEQRCAFRSDGAEGRDTRATAARTGGATPLQARARSVVCCGYHSEASRATDGRRSRALSDSARQGWTGNREVRLMSHPGPEAGAGDSRTRRANPALSRSWIGLPIPLLLVTILTLWRATSPDTRESWVLGLTLTILFSSLTALAATTLASLDFLASGSLGSLLLGCGALFWSGAGGIGMLLGRNDIDSQVAFHNLSAWFAAACHLAGVLLARRPRLVAAARVQLPLAYSSVVGLTLVIALAARMHLLPPFFMQGQGGTALRQAVLGSAAGMFALAGAILAVRNRTKRSTFTRWYSLSLALIAVGLVGVLLQANVGSLVGWAGRAAQFLGGVYMLVAVAAARHGSEALNRALRTSLREAEQRLQTLVDIAPDAIIAHQDGRFIYANGRALSLYGAGSAAELLGRSVLDLVHPDDRDAVRKRIALAEAGATSPLHPLRIVRLDGDAVPVETTASAFEYRGRTAIQVILRDIRERIESEQALRNSEATLDAFFESSPAVLGICDEELRILRTDTITPAVFGLTRDAVVGRPARDLAPDFVQRFGPLMRQVLDTGIPELNREVTTTVPIRGGDAAHWRVSCFPIPLSGSRRGIGVVGVEITDIKRAEAEREHLVAALREADRRKNEFLAVLSHELRNPLTPIRNSLHVLEHAVAGGPEARHAQAVIVRQVDHLVRLIDDLLDVTRISRGKIRLQRDRLDLRALARATVEDYRRGFLAKAVELETDMPAAPVWVDGDATRLAQAIGNLVANASKFTSSGDRVSLTLRRHGRDAILRVSDTGAGITPEVLDELFVPFKQAQQTLDRSQGGIGLGLALVKSFAEMHGGSVSAHSDGPGKGAAFTLTLPTVDVGARPAPAPAPATVRPRPRRILLIEDNLDAAESLQTALHFGGHQVAVARSGPEGLERVRTFLPDAVLCDIGLPGMDGFEVARRLRSDPRLGSMPLVALTGYALPDDLERARAAGFSRHLAKPADVETVLAALSELLPDP